jgi:hypothetical protein
VYTLTNHDMRRLFTLLDEELRLADVEGDLYLVGGAVMCLVHAARSSTQDVHGLFRPARQVREAAARVAARASVPIDWLNDAVKGYLSPQGEFSTFLELPNLRIMVAQPQYLLAMKCLSMRIGAEFHDEDDVRFLLRLLDVRSYEQAVSIIERYYPIGKFPQKTLYALGELLPERG